MPRGSILHDYLRALKLKSRGSDVMAVLRRVSQVRKGQVSRAAMKRERLVVGPMLPPSVPVQASAVGRTLIRSTADLRGHVHALHLDK